MKILIVILIACIFAPGSRAEASNLLGSSCVIVQSQGFTRVAFAAPAQMTCENLKRMKESVEMIQLSLMPAMTAFMVPGVREAVAADLAAVGLTLANPAVLGITVLGATGVVTLYVVLKRSMEECEAADRRLLKEEILRELKEQYNLRGSGPIELEL